MDDIQHIRCHEMIMMMIVIIIPSNFAGGCRYDLRVKFNILIMFPCVYNYSILLVHYSTQQIGKNLNYENFSA